MTQRTRHPLGLAATSAERGSRGAAARVEVREPPPTLDGEPEDFAELSTSNLLDGFMKAAGDGVLDRVPEQAAGGEEEIGAGGDGDLPPGIAT
eukprot:scaffold50699_cov31-Tisochrysis_lutea.AAC.1